MPKLKTKKKKVENDNLHFVGTFRGRNLYLETPDIEVVKMFNDFTENQEHINRLYQEIVINQKMANFQKIYMQNSPLFKLAKKIFYPLTYAIRSLLYK